MKKIVIAVYLKHSWQTKRLERYSKFKIKSQYYIHVTDSSILVSANRIASRILCSNCLVSGFKFGRQ